VINRRKKSSRRGIRSTLKLNDTTIPAATKNIQTAAAAALETSLQRHPFS